jgi:hypothetical protein
MITISSQFVADHCRIRLCAYSDLIRDHTHVVTIRQRVIVQENLPRERRIPKDICQERLKTSLYTSSMQCHFVVLKGKVSRIICPEFQSLYSAIMAVVETIIDSDSAIRQVAVRHSEALKIPYTVVPFPDGI